MNKAAFLDRDGVINLDHAYVHRIEDFDWVDGILTAAARLHEAGYRLVIVTNQSGIGRGYYDEASFECLNKEIRARFALVGAPLAGIYFCPHHPEKALEPYRMRCTCRKPEPGMLLQAAKELDIDLSQSLMFGDKRSDMQAALRAGIPTRVLVGTDGLACPNPVPECTHTARSVFEALEQLPML